MPLDIKKPGYSPSGMLPRALFEDIAAGFTRPAVSIPELNKVYEAEHQAHYLQPPFQALFSSHGQQDHEKQCGLSGFAAAPHEALKCSQKRFLIFDQSGNQTRLLRCALPLQYPSTVTGEPGKLPDLQDLEKGLRKDNLTPDKFFSGQDFDDSHLNGEESEMHEDTEEINALLYSDEDDDNDSYCESDEDVMSTGHSPFPNEEVCSKIELEEINSDDSPRKRQKLLDGGCCTSSLVDAESSIEKKRLVKDENLPESNSSSKQEMGSGLSNEQSKTDKIRTALKILESVVPGAKGKEALLLLDEAIDYLKLLKQNVKSLGVNRW